MPSIFKFIVGFLKDEEGVTAIEYGLIAALIAVVIIVSAALVGNRLDCVFNHIANCLTNAGCGALNCGGGAGA